MDYITYWALLNHFFYIANSSHLLQAKLLAIDANLIYNIEFLLFYY